MGCLGEERFVGPGLCGFIGDFRIDVPIRLQPMLEEIPVNLLDSVDTLRRQEDIQFPSSVAQLGASLAQVDVADLGGQVNESLGS